MRGPGSEQARRTQPEGALSPEGGAGRRPIILLLAGVCVVVLAIAVAEAIAVVNMRNSTLRNVETNLKSLSIALAEQANQTFHGVDLVLSELAGSINPAASADPTAAAVPLAGQDMHLRLGDRMTGLPALSALWLVDARGMLVNSSVTWPAPRLDLAESEYFRAMRHDASAVRFFSRPEHDAATGQWDLRVVHRLSGPDGQFRGLVIGTISLGYFERLYRAAVHGADQTISLLRRDDILLARFPATDRIGMPVRFGERRAGADPGTAIARSGVDGIVRIKAASELADFPMVVRVTRSQTTALQEWTALVGMIGLVSLGCLIWIAIAALALARWWRQQQTLGLERAERAEAERARALAQADLARERERHAEESSRAKSGFLAMMSHEIRTPMNGVLGLAGTLLDGDLSAEQRRVVEAIRDSGDSLLRILNDILDLSKLDAERMTFEDVPFSPTTLTHGIVSILGPRARAKGLIITVSCDHVLPAAVLGDAGRIRQVLLNLVSNAIKFTDTGSVTIECRRMASRDERIAMQWQVRDTGIGIAQDRVGTLFGDFVQADTTIARRFGGTGMGLAISRRLVEQMGGTITVRSQPGEGTTFRVDLALPETTPVTDADRRDTDVVGAFEAYLRTLGRPLRLLFAEDNPTNQFVALQMLRMFNVQVDVAGDGLEAVDAATTFLYDVICMDMRMPEMDGLEATRLIRRQGGRLATLPIIALTANAFPEDVRACLDAGMTLFVAKPVQKETLLHAILTALGAVTRFTPPDAILPSASEEPMPTLPDPGEPVIAMHTLAEMEDAIGAEGVAEMVQLFESETHARLDRLAQASRDRSVDLREIHTLKGAAATVGAPALTGLAMSIETRLRDGATLTDDEVARLRHAFLAWRTAMAKRLPITQAQG
jgi:signal transduction histidine kinase/DNA-binding NarL/FixJ family response regulator